MSLPDALLWLFAPQTFAFTKLFLLSHSNEYGRIENP